MTPAERLTVEGPRVGQPAPASAGLSAGFRPVLADGCLAGLSVWVTGAGSGIGRAIAHRAAALGARVGGCGRRPTALAETAALIEADGGRFEWQDCDVRDTDAAVAALDRFAAAEGLDGLVNNAGGQFHASAETISPRGFAAVVDLNLNAVFALSRAAHRWMTRDEQRPRHAGGAIVNLSLSPVERGALGMAHAIAARSGVAGLARALALEWGADGLRINCVAPGAVDTEAFRAKRGDGLDRALLSSTPLGRHASEAEVAELTAFLLSPAGALITGQVLRIDGGMFLGAPIDLRPVPARAEGGCAPADGAAAQGERPDVTDAAARTVARPTAEAA